MMSILVLLYHSQNNALMEREKDEEFPNEDNGLVGEMPVRNPKNSPVLYISLFPTNGKRLKWLASSLECHYSHIFAPYRTDKIAGKSQLCAQIERLKRHIFDEVEA